VRLATIRRGGATTAARIDDGVAVPIDGVADLRTLLEASDWRQRAESAAGSPLDLAVVDFAPLVPAPDKVVCVGLNYRNHIAETGREPPAFPTLFAKFRSALIGARDDIALSPAVEQLDWEAEMAVVIGAPARNLSEADAPRAIAGYSVLNDISARDWQRRTTQWLQGKTFEGSTPVGPWMVTSDEFDGLSGEISCEVNGETMQCSDVGDLVFGPAALVSYISSIVTLLPGDLIATGTPGGVGVARTPPQFLAKGDVVTVRVAGVGACTNTVVSQ
jgi:acylpyruvate hydrolase